MSCSACWRWLAPGIATLADAPLEPNEAGPDPSGEVKLLANRVHALGQKTRAAPPADRPGVYGQLLATYAACHGYFDLGAGNPPARQF